MSSYAVGPSSPRSLSCASDVGRVTRLAVRSCAWGVSAGMRPSGGSTMTDMRFWPSIE